MKPFHHFLSAFLLFPSLIVTGQDTAPKPTKITLGTYPSLSPDGKRIAFGWAGDIWLGTSGGGQAKRFTTNAATEHRPHFSPDGKWIAFNREVGGKEQVFVVPVGNGIPRQVTFHGNGSRLLDWYPDGKSLLITGSRDFGTRNPTRFYRVTVNERKPESLLFDGEGVNAAISPDGKRLLFTREGYDLYRKGYEGTKASQIWLAENLETGSPKFTKLIARKNGARAPIWKPDGSGFYFAGNHGAEKQFNMWFYDFKSKKEAQVTSFTADAAIAPALSADGMTMVFRKEFEFKRLDLSDGIEKTKAEVILLTAADDSIRDATIRRILTKATNMSFSPDGLEIAFAAGGDIWVMDTILKEPKQVTRTEIEEREPVFAPDGKAIYFIRESVEDMDIWNAKAKDNKRYFWQNNEFVETQITTTKVPKNDLRTVSGGKKISYIEGQGSLFTADLNGKNPRRHVESWNQPDYHFSPDGKWLAYSIYDSNFNRDVWIQPLDNHRKPFNLSRHPDNDSSPRWSPNGKILAFVGRRFGDETDIYYVHLTPDAEEEDKREKTLKTAIEKMKKERKATAPTAKPKEEKKPESTKSADPAMKTKLKDPEKPAPKAEPKPKASSKPEQKSDPKPKPAPAKPALASNPKIAPKKPATPPAKKIASPPKNLVKIDFTDLYERIRRIKLEGSTESNLLWAHDSKRLAFVASSKSGSKGMLYVTFPTPSKPTVIKSSPGGLARWDAKNDTIYWLVKGIPSTYSRGKATAYPFRVNQEYNRNKYQRAAFHQIWRKMRDTWYDENLNNRDWTEIRKKYEDAAGNAIDRPAFERVAAMLLGELNGSHLGFRGSSTGLPSTTSSSIVGKAWVDSTQHLGVKFDLLFKGPGLKISSIIPGSTTDQKSIDLVGGDIVLKINGKAVSIDTDLTKLLNGLSSEDFQLTLKGRKGDKTPGKERSVIIRSTTYSTATRLLQNDQFKKNRGMVDELSKGRIGYVHVSRMAWNEFIKFEEEIFARGAGKEGLIIDVRDNGGGFTADHLLTVLSPSRHAIAVPRGGGPGYPQDRLVYASYTQPILVLCNQNSFSNAEIFCHAIKELGRGKLVGVQTAGGVISTGTAMIMDVGSLRIPFRGWYRLSDGKDMELNGAIPDLIVWPEPSDQKSGRDRQIEAGVKMLTEEIAAKQKNTDLPKFDPVSESRK